MTTESAAPSPSGPVRFVMAPSVSDDSWLMEERFAAFVSAYGYARTQTNAIYGLAKITPEEAYHVWAAITHGMGMDPEALAENEHERPVDE